MKPIDFASFDCLGPEENPYHEANVLELRHYETKDDGEVTWMQGSLFYRLLEAPWRPKYTDDQLEAWMKPKRDDGIIPPLAPPWT